MYTVYATGAMPGSSLGVSAISNRQASADVEQLAGSRCEPLLGTYFSYPAPGHAFRVHCHEYQLPSILSTLHDKHRQRRVLVVDALNRVWTSTHVVIPQMVERRVKLRTAGEMPEDPWFWDGECFIYTEFRQNN